EHVMVHACQMTGFGCILSGAFTRRRSHAGLAIQTFSRDDFHCHNLKRRVARSLLETITIAR
ncbi:MAG: hypothetical protein WBF64_10115, partial [Xanthobacteraceae bacterium]